MARILVRCLSNLGCVVCYFLDGLVFLATLGYYLPMMEMRWLSWTPLIRLKMRYRA